MHKILLFNVMLSLAIFPMMTQCGDEHYVNCPEIVLQGTQQDLSEITPLNLTYNQGEVINFKFSIPSEIQLDNKTIDIYEHTNASSGYYNQDLLELIDQNTVTYINGSKDADYYGFKAEYNSSANAYELEFDVTLNKTGIYSFNSYGTFNISNNSGCNLVHVNTTTIGDNDNKQKIEFFVQ